MTNRQRLLNAIRDNDELLERLLIIAEPEEPVERVDSPRALYQIVAPELVGWGTEHFVVVALNRALKPIGVATLSIGTDGFTIIDPKGVYRWALQQGRSGAYAIAVAHNHPSNQAGPSNQDVQVTEHLSKAGRLLGIQLVDHLVVTDDGYTSMAEKGFMSVSPIDRYSLLR